MVSQDGAPSISVSFARDRRVATVVIDRPERRNALTQDMWQRLASLFAELGANTDVRVVVLKGAGDDFCAGADIAEFDTVRAEAGSARLYEADNSAAFAAIRHCAKPTIAAIRGVCFGGGFGIAAACDLRIASRTALFSVPAARLGLAYPVDAMPDIVAALGPQMAKYLAFSAARIDAPAALAAGFVLEVVEPAGLDLRADELALAIADNAPLSVQASKASIRSALSGKEVDGATAVLLGDRTFGSSDYAEGRAAFREKRRPLFSGT